MVHVLIHSHFRISTPVNHHSSDVEMRLIDYILIMWYSGKVSKVVRKLKSENHGKQMGLLRIGHNQLQWSIIILPIKLNFWGYYSIQFSDRPRWPCKANQHVQVCYPRVIKNGWLENGRFLGDLPKKMSIHGGLSGTRRESITLAVTGPSWFCPSFWRICNFPNRQVLTQAYVREYPHKIWPYMYLKFRSLKFPLTSILKPACNLLDTPFLRPHTWHVQILR